MFFIEALVAPAWESFSFVLSELSLKDGIVEFQGLWWLLVKEGHILRVRYNLLATLIGGARNQPQFVKGPSYCSSP
jgi:hypothetical protein